MKIKELTVRATIPTSQYANIIPEITVEVNGDYEEAKAEAMLHISQFSQDYAEKGKEIGESTKSTEVKLEKLIPYIGTKEMFFDEQNHVYTDVDGKKYTSASTIAKQFEHPFPIDVVVPAYAKKFGVQEQRIRDFWKSKADASTTFGTALHQALETYGKWNNLANELNTPDKPVEIGIHPTLLPIVESFFEGRYQEVAVYEPFIVDEEDELCGKVDRLVIVDLEKKICDIEDYKTNGDLYKERSPKFLKAPHNDLPNTPFGGYTIQQNVYRKIVEANGWTVRNLTLHHWGGAKWERIPVPKVKV